MMSVIQAASSMSVMPGSDGLWFVHSGQYRGMSRTASATMSSKARSSSFGAGIIFSASGSDWALLLGLGLQIERIHEVPLRRVRDDRVLDVDVDLVGLIGRGPGLDLHVPDARLVLEERFLAVVRGETAGVRVVRREDEVVNVAAERRPHDPLSRRGAEDDEDRIADALLEDRHRDAAGSVDVDGESPTLPEEGFG